MQAQFERLTDGQWEVIKSFLNWQRKRELSLRDVFDAILWIARTGAQWRNLDSQFPKWSAVYYYFEKWTSDGTLEQINLALNMLERIQQDRIATPSLGLSDSQSVKLSPRIIEQRGTDGNKWVNGRKRHILVDVLGRIWKTQVHAANIHDSPGGVGLLENCKKAMPTLKKVMADKSYRGTFAKAVEEKNLTFEVPVREEGKKGFVVEAKRWVVERTFAWLNFFRRTVIDHERTIESAQSFLTLANISIVI
ncbi:IS5 family transposase [Catalinimonas sp. 4WD22]|uniref:IS5 family transposase n=1 Tax=Catalinimonas locisalis TaxID=3133978 RepID=UPI003101A47B